MSAGNGSLMRLSPVAIRFWNDRAKLVDAAARQSKTTHGAPEAVDACIAFANVLADAIKGGRLSEVLRNRPDVHERAISAIMKGSWRGKHRDKIRSSAYVVHTLEAALWCVARTGDFRSAVLLAANLADDADTTAAVVGQLAGGIYGVRGIPKTWVKRVAWRARIIKYASGLLAASGVRA